MPEILTVGSPFCQASAVHQQKAELLVETSIGRDCDLLGLPWENPAGFGPMTRST